MLDLQYKATRILKSPYALRATVFFALLMVPFARMLLQYEYGFAHLEVFLIGAIALSLAAGLAAVTRRPFIFHSAVVFLVTLTAANAIRTELIPDLRIRYIFLGSIALIAFGQWIFKQHFYLLFLLFLAGQFAVDVTSALADSRWVQVEPSSESLAAGHDHVIHVILDEMAGLAALPQECRSCIRAGRIVQQNLEDADFNIYPFAFSNYTSTADSLPSILNGRLLERTLEYFPRAFASLPLQENRYFDAYLKKGYAIQVYQPDFIDFAPPNYPTVQADTYKIADISKLHDLPTSWRTRFGTIAGVYLRSDQFLLELFERFLPEDYLPDMFMVSPLSLAGIWPDRVLEDYRTASENTLFFVHLLLPHYPYVYRSDGSVTDSSRWNAQEKRLYYEDESTEFWRMYESYGQQLEWVATQLEGFLAGLRDAGGYSRTTVILHGDHGSRLRLLRTSEREPRLDDGVDEHDDYDYQRGGPDSRDLLNRFATLFAIKHPGAVEPNTISEKGSVLYFLQKETRIFDDVPDYNALNSFYLANKDRSMERIPMLHAWRNPDLESY